MLLTAKVPNDHQTLWWLMGFGSKVDVIEPLHWRKTIYDQAEQIIARGLAIN